VSGPLVRTVRRWVRRSIRLAFTPSMFSHGSVQLLRPLAGSIPARIRDLIPVRGVFDVEGAMGVTYRMEFDGTDGSPEWIFWDGLSRYELATQRLLRRLLPMTKCFLDVGANAGAYTFAAALQPHRPQVHAFEPEPYSLAQLRRNVQINDLRNVAVYGVALADESGTSLLYLPFHGHTTSTLVQRASSAVEVAVTTLDEWASNRELQRVDVIKTDTEGTEDRVLRGGHNLVERDRPFIICEVWPDHQMEEALTALLDQLGYLAYHLTATGLEFRDQIVGDPAWLEVNYLLVPRERRSEMPEEYGSP
jgi:FkbM family methyltransferase